MDILVSIGGSHLHIVLNIHVMFHDFFTICGLDLLTSLTNIKQESAKQMNYHDVMRKRLEYDNLET